MRDKVEFLALINKRDLEGIRRQGPALLAGRLQRTDSAFHGYVLAGTIAACLAALAPDADCEQVIARLDAIDGSSPMIDLLRSHQRTAQTTASPGGGYRAPTVPPAK